MEGVLIEINESLKKRLPDTFAILKESHLTVHPYVYKVVLSGSRGLAENYREDSDIDLSLLVDTEQLNSEKDREKTLKEILDITLSNWSSETELDTAAVFEINKCRLNCFNYENYQENICEESGIDCMGLYKTQKGFNGYVPKIGVNIKFIYPIITVWERENK